MFQRNVAGFWKQVLPLPQVN